MKYIPNQLTGGSEQVDDPSILTISQPEIKRPPLYKILLLNDDFTPMEFGIVI